MIVAITQGGPRLPENLRAALDAGADGIVAPYVESVDEVRGLVGAVHYRPIKGRQLRDFLSGARQPATARCCQRIDIEQPQCKQHDDAHDCGEHVRTAELLTPREIRKRGQ